MTVARKVRKALQYAGIDVKRYRGEDEFLRRALLLRANGIDRVIDVGANMGQYALALRKAGYNRRITSVEPIPQAFEALSAAASKDPGWDVCRCAVGSEPGEEVLNIAGNLGLSSSLLSMGDRTTDIHPEAGYIGTEVVSVRTLDDIVGPTENPEPTFVKLDVQGFEDRVLDGGAATLAHARGVELELSLVPLYENSQTYLPMVSRLEEQGFRLRLVFPVFGDPRTGEFLQVDGVFFRE